MDGSITEQRILAEGGRIEAHTVHASLGMTLQAKWIVVFSAAVLYLIAVGLIAAQQRSELRTMIDELEAVRAAEESLTKINTLVAHTLVKLQDVYDSPDMRTGLDALVLETETIQAELHTLAAPYPGLDVSTARLGRGLAALRMNPAPNSFFELRDSLNQVAARLNETIQNARIRGSELSVRSRLIYDKITMIIVIGGLVGIIAFGGVITLFLTRLVWDITKVQERALEIVRGYRGMPLEVTRRDEIGGLMQSVNSMQSALRVREQQLEVSRQQHFHQDKMAAIGSLAAAVAHEINNPIAAIHGIAQSIRTAQASGECPRNGACQPDLILEQTRRIAQITHHLGEMTAQPSPKPQLLDLNALVRNVCSFVRYDKRLRSVELALDLDSQLPALLCVADHVTQVLMNLLINAADATEGIRGRKPRVSVKTEAAGGGIRFAVTDNGCGMSDETLAHAFEEGFTTKPVGKGTGLGLFICKSLVEQCGGAIRIVSETDRGTEIVIQLPSHQLMPA